MWPGSPPLPAWACCWPGGCRKWPRPQDAIRERCKRHFRAAIPIGFRISNRGTTAPPGPFFSLLAYAWACCWPGGCDHDLQELHLFSGELVTRIGPIGQAALPRPASGAGGHSDSIRAGGFHPGGNPMARGGAQRHMRGLRKERIASVKQG